MPLPTDIFFFFLKSLCSEIVSVVINFTHLMICIMLIIIIIAEGDWGKLKCLKQNLPP